MTAKSCSSRQRSASSPDVRAHEPLAERLENRLEREQILGAVVDEQNVDLVARRSASSSVARVIDATPSPAADRQRAECRRDLARCVSARASGTLAAPPSASPDSRRSPDVCTNASPPRSTMRFKPRAPSAFAPVSTTPTDAIAVRVRRGLEASRRSTDGCSAPARPSTSEKMSALDEQVIVRRRDVDVARLDRRLVLDLAHAQRRVDPAASVVNRWSDSLWRCCTTTSGTPKSLPAARRSAREARPARPTTFRRRRSRRPRLSDLPVQLLARIQLLVASARTGRTAATPCCRARECRTSRDSRRTACARGSAGSRSK